MKINLRINRIVLLAVLLCVMAALLGSCVDTEPEAKTFAIRGEKEITLTVGQRIDLGINFEGDEGYDPASTKWSASNSCVEVNKNGTVTALRAGAVIITASRGEDSDCVYLTIIGETTDVDTVPGSDGATEPDTERVDIETGNVNTETQKPVTETQKAETEPETEPDYNFGDDFYDNYRVARSYNEAIERSRRGLMSGYLEVPDQKPTISSYRPALNGKLIRNSKSGYVDENTYKVVDAYGNEVLRVYRGGGYITLEEVAAYVYAFGDVPANYISGKSASPSSNIWGKYLRLNHSKFSGSTTKYPYEPELPDISGCGGSLQYYEIDIGTTGTDCDPAYYATIYNNGSRITRGAARIVYARFDRNGNGVTDPEEKYVFYTYNHYNDFQQYLNYYGGWGYMFGNITGGGTLSSKTHYNPTPYIETVLAPLPGTRTAETVTDRCAILYTEALYLADKFKGIFAA